MKVSHVMAVALLGALAGPSLAHADPESLNPDAFDLSAALVRPVSPTGTGIEIGLAGGYTQGVGGAGATGRIEDLTGPGGAGELQVGYRVSPRFSAGVYGTLARFRAGDAIPEGSAHGATAGVQVVWHAVPDSSVDPWIGLGAGWRGLWLSQAGARSSTHGIEMLRVQLGVDYRVTSRLAIAPMVSASVSMFLVENAATPDDFTAIRDKRLNFYGFTGVLGRFDVGG